MCALSILFAYKVGLFNIGAAGQYVRRGSCACLYAALAWGWRWLAVHAAGDRRPARCSAAISGPAESLLQRQRGHLRHHAQLDRPLRHEHDPDERQGGHQPLYPPDRRASASRPILPSLGFDKLLGDNKYITMAIPLSDPACHRGLDRDGKDDVRLRAKGHGLQQKRREILRHGRKSATRSSRSSSQVRWPASAARSSIRRAMSSGSVRQAPSRPWASTASRRRSSAA